MRSSAARLVLPTGTPPFGAVPGVPELVGASVLVAEVQMTGITTNKGGNPAFRNHHGVCECSDYRHQHYDGTGRCFVCPPWPAHAGPAKCSRYRSTARAVAHPGALSCQGCAA